MDIAGGLYSLYFTRHTLQQYYNLLEERFKTERISAYDILLMWDCQMRLHESDQDKISNYLFTQKLNSKSEKVRCINFTFRNKSKKLLNCYIEGKLNSQNVTLTTHPIIDNNYNSLPLCPLPNFFEWIEKEINK